MTIYLDCEWTIDQDIFLIGYIYSNGRVGSLYDSKLSKRSFMRLLEGVDFIIVYGPDIAYLEKYFDIDLRQEFICINALKLFRKTIIGLPSYRLSYIEELYSIIRKKRKYKTSVFTIWHDWSNPAKRYHVIIYNQEDVINLMKLFRIISNEYRLTDEIILTCRLV